MSRVTPREIAFSQLPHLSAAAESGDVGRHRGLLPERFHQAPTDLNQGWRRFLDNHGPERQPAPKPSAASQPTPKRRSI